VNLCRRPLDLLDAEALASGERPVYAADAAEHVRNCPTCSEAVSRAAAFDAVLDEVGRVSASAAASPDLADGVVRLRAFSRRERRDFSLWRGPLLLAVALAVSGVVLLALPGLTIREQAGLSAAAFAPVLALLRALARSVSGIAAAAPSGLEALGSALRGQGALGIALLLLLAPVLWGFSRAVARERRR
jgi:predicted anti-sigma-YlaC factor YlaD